MLASKNQLILKELELGTGASIQVEVGKKGPRTSLGIWFADLDKKHGPYAELRPYGLRGHQIDLRFGDFSGSIIAQIRTAAPEDVQLARALVGSIRSEVRVEILNQALETWVVSNGQFRMTATVRDHERPNDDAAVISTCREVLVPIMAAMAELIGYDVMEELVAEELAVDGAVSYAAVKRRERNPRNRLLCLRIHGEKCAGCDMQPHRKYGDAGEILEVHHLEPVSLLTQPRPYDPRTDLVPLCPSCHRAVHTRRPLPWSIEDLRARLKATSE